MERLTIPDVPIDGGMRRAIIDARAVRQQAMTIYWKLKEYEDLEEQGKLLKLPAAIGDEVFSIYRECPKDYKREYCRDHKGSCEECDHRELSIRSKEFSPYDIPHSKIFFATKEEAEAELKKLES